MGAKSIVTLLVVVILAGGVWYYMGKQTIAPVRDSETSIPTGTSDATGGATPGNTDSSASGGGITIEGDGNVSIEVEPVGDNPFEALVSYTESGFSPASVTIKRGQTVRFVNNAGRETWPASAFHPTHGVYPEKSGSDCLGSSFDACRGLKPGEFWEFTFNTVGSWKYHDHLSASKTGTIVVQ